MPASLTLFSPRFACYGFSIRQLIFRHATLLLLRQNIATSFADGEARHAYRRRRAMPCCTRMSFSAITLAITPYYTASSRQCHYATRLLMLTCLVPKSCHDDADAALLCHQCCRCRARYDAAFTLLRCYDITPPRYADYLRNTLWRRAAPYVDAWRC